MRLIVCGGRQYNDYNAVSYVLRGWLTNYTSQLVVIHGNAPGADSLADRWCRENGVPAISVHAQWNYYGNSAGMLRNRWMRDLLNPDAVLAFPGGAGTAGMKRLAREHGLPVYEVSA